MSDEIDYLTPQDRRTVEYVVGSATDIDQAIRIHSEELAKIEPEYDAIRRTVGMRRYAIQLLEGRR
jgi:hypothetical protein